MLGRDLSVLVSVLLILQPGMPLLAFAGFVQVLQVFDYQQLHMRTM